MTKMLLISQDMRERIIVRVFISIVDWMDFKRTGIQIITAWVKKRKTTLLYFKITLSVRANNNKMIPEILVVDINIGYWIIRTLRMKIINRV